MIDNRLKYEKKGEANKGEVEFNEEILFFITLEEIIKNYPHELEKINLYIGINAIVDDEGNIEQLGFVKSRLYFGSFKFGGFKLKI